MKDILIKWYKAHKLAEENPRLLCYHSTAEEATNASNICSERMKECDAIDVELFKLSFPLLNLFKEAAANLPDCSCNVHSNPSMHHPECDALWAEWFAYRAVLMTYVFERYIRNTEHETRLSNSEIAEEVTEEILIKLSNIPLVGDALEAIPMQDYEHLEAFMTHIIERAL